MAEIKVGDKVRLTQDVSYSNHKKGDIGVVTRTSEGLTSLIRVRMEYNNTNGDTAPFEPYEIELVEELEPLKLEHLKVGQLVIRKSDGWQRFITEVVEDKISYLCGSKGENLTIGFISLETEFIGYYRLPDISEVAQFKKYNPDLFAEYVMPEESVADAISPSVYQFPNGVEVRSVSSTGAEKGVKASRFSLLPMEALTEVANHYGVGATKYKDHNMRRGYEWSKSYDALMRHATQFWSGEDHDEETGSKHLAAVVFHALTLMEFMESHPEFDDRYKLTK